MRKEYDCGELSEAACQKGAELGVKARALGHTSVDKRSSSAERYGCQVAGPLLMMVDDGRWSMLTVLCGRNAYT